MAGISAKEVHKLRQKTGLSMMECKKALVETDGDLEKAEDFLRKKLKGKMDTRTDRAAGEGRIEIVIKDDGSAASIVELRAETDFTAKNEKFIELTSAVAGMAIEEGAGTISATDAMTKQIDEVRITSGENCSFARGQKLDASGGKFGKYLHFDGKTGVLLHYEGEIAPETVNDICLHIVGAPTPPMGLTSDDIPADIAEKERKFRIEQAMESGKPQEIAEKMVEGGMRKFFSGIALLEQDFVKDPSRKIKELVGDAKIVAFHRWAVGEEG